MTHAYDVSREEFSGMGPTWQQEFENQQARNDVMAAAMDIIEHPELHKTDTRKAVPVKAVSRLYNLADDKERLQYEADVLRIARNEDGNIQLFDHPSKQLVQTPDGFKYIAYLEWVEIGKLPVEKEKPEIPKPAPTKRRKRR